MIPPKKPIPCIQFSSVIDPAQFPPVFVRCVYMCTYICSYHPPLPIAHLTPFLPSKALLGHTFSHISLYQNNLSIRYRTSDMERIHRSSTASPSLSVKSYMLFFHITLIRTRGAPVGHHFLPFIIRNAFYASGLTLRNTQVYIFLCFHW